jgi:hypothetical protein
MFFQRAYLLFILMEKSIINKILLRPKKEKKAGIVKEDLLEKLALSIRLILSKNEKF